MTTMIEQEEYVRKYNRKKSAEFANALAIWEDAKIAYEQGQITEENLHNIAEQLDL